MYAYSQFLSCLHVILCNFNFYMHAIKTLHRASYMHACSITIMHACTNPFIASYLACSLLQLAFLQLHSQLANLLVVKHLQITSQLYSYSYIQPIIQLDSNCMHRIQLYSYCFKTLQGASGLKQVAIVITSLFEAAWIMTVTYRGVKLGHFWLTNLLQQLQLYQYGSIIKCCGSCFLTVGWLAIVSYRKMLQLDPCN